MSIPRRLLAAVAGLMLVATACTQAISGSPHGSSARLGSPAASSSAPSSASSASSGRPSTAGPTAPTPQPIAFRDCTTQLEAAGLPVPSALKGKLSVGCGQLSVPLDYDDPGKGQVVLAVVRMHDTDDPNPTGSLLINPGGPGASGLQFALQFLGEVPLAVMQKFDLIGFDPRGVGESSPIHCVSNKQKDQIVSSAPDVTTPGGFAEAEKAAKDFAAACEKAYGSALPFYNTENTARDMDQIRQGVGDDKMNYLGFSYGTELGWVYAHLFPDKVRAVVLDGAVDPDTTGIEQFAQQLQGFEDAFDQFAANCKTVSPCNQLSDPRRTALQVTSAARDQPLPTSTDRTVSYALAFTGILQALYSKALWPQLAAGLISAGQGDGTGLLRLADLYNERSPSGGFTNILDANTTISCNDSAPGPSSDTLRRTATEWVTKFPLFGRWSGSSLFSCQPWQPHRTIVPKPKAATPAKVLVVGNLHDPATPYQGAKDLTRDLGNAELLSWDGEGHTSYLQGSSCINDYVNKYLVAQALPADGTTCPR